MTCATCKCLIASTYSDSPPTFLELKPSLESLKYSFLGPNESSPVIIISNLDWDQEEKLIDLFKENKDASGWTLGNIKGISPSIVKIGSINFEPYQAYPSHMNPTL